MSMNDLEVVVMTEQYTPTTEEVRELIAEAREQAAYLRGVSRDGSMPYSGELLESLSDALEAVRAEHDAALACIADLEMALMAEVAKMRGREPIAICLDEACDEASGGRSCENRKAVE